jgi:2-oxo-4-hydroxy-4-carboxy-5-ureidoimidazoline decarboxylase
LIEAQERLYWCFASRRWAQRVAETWPYPDLDSLLDAAERAWSQLEPSDWAEALAGHPRIGEGGGSSPTASEREQSGVRVAASGTLERLAAENRVYEARFGHVFLIDAAGKSAEHILAALRKRMENDPVSEARVASAELRKIARRRLEELIPSPPRGEG